MGEYKCTSEVPEWVKITTYVDFLPLRFII